MHDVTFLQTVANQVAFGLTNAFAIGQLEELNASLERQVQDRTAALATSNAELNLSLEKLRTAYQLLERNQSSLVRADRLATLGRLTAGIAHEINTPLGALLNSVKILSDLGQEYADSIDDPSVLLKDHHEIAAEILGTAGSAAEWARKAAIFIKKVKMHGRDARSDVRESFTARGLVEETTALLAYRLRTSLCQVDYSEEPKGVGITGDPSLLGQVLVNLIGNALDAYEEREGGGRIDIRVGVSIADFPDHHAEVSYMRHLVVEEQNVRPTPVDRLSKISPVVRFPNDLDIARSRQRYPQHLTKHGVVVGDHHPEHGAHR